MGVYRQHVSISEELKDMAIADIGLSVAFAILLSGGIFSSVSKGFSLLYLLPITFMAVTLSFLPHEYMHKKVAERFGIIAAFKRSDFGIIVALFTSMFGFLMALPGATMLYTNTLTRKQDGYVSIAGPLTNFAIFLLLFAVFYLSNINHNSYLAIGLWLTLYINIWLSFINMLPVYPLDGSKILAWNKGVYAALLVTVFVLLFSLNPGIAIIESMLFSFVLIVVLAKLSTGMLFRPL